MTSMNIQYLLIYVVVPVDRYVRVRPLPEHQRDLPESPCGRLVVHPALDPCGGRPGGVYRHVRPVAVPRYGDIDRVARSVDVEAPLSELELGDGDDRIRQDDALAVQPVVVVVDGRSERAPDPLL